MTDQVTVSAHAKVNLFLRVLSREDTGYHSIETLFSLLELADGITVERTDSGVDLSVEGADTGPTEENLAYKAAQLVLEATGNRFGVAIEIAKNIPVEAGLGGGSGDGAAVLHAVNKLAAEAVPRHEIIQFAAKLGSDVPFFASGAPMAVAWGRGERLFRIAPPKQAPVLLAVPSVSVSTKEAYALLDSYRGDDPRRGTVVLDVGAFDTWGSIGRLSGNDFEAAIFGKEPRVRELFERVAGTRPLLVRMSGSGSAIVAVYKNERELDDAAAMVGERGQKLIKTMSRSRPAEGPKEVRSEK